MHYFEILFRQVLRKVNVYYFQKYNALKTFYKNEYYGCMFPVFNFGRVCKECFEVIWCDEYMVQSPIICLIYTIPALYQLRLPIFITQVCNGLDCSELIIFAIFYDTMYRYFYIILYCINNFFAIIRQAF